MEFYGKFVKNTILVMSHSGPVIPAFVDLSEAEQASELLAFLKGLGAEVSGKVTFLA